MIRVALCLLCLSAMVFSVAAAQVRTVPENEMIQRAVQARVAIEEDQYVSVIHSEADRASASIGNMRNGTPLTLIEERGGFYKIDCYGMEGYVAKSQVASKNGQSYIRCVIGSEETLAVPVFSGDMTLELQRSLLLLATEQLGKPYIYGSTGPNGFDCSGLTTYLYESVGVQLDRRASQQLGNGVVVDPESLQCGDLLFFRTPWETALTSHVGIYAGNNTMIHAGNRGIECVELDGSYYEGYFLCARRILNTTEPGK